MVKNVPIKNVKKLVKKQVQRAEKKAHPKRTKGALRNVTRARARQITKGAGKQVVAKINALSAGASLERRAAAYLAKRLCCPNMFESYAVQDGFNSMPVGAANPYMVTAMPFSAAANTFDGLGINSDESWLFAFRDPHRCLLFYDPIARTWEYNGVQDTGSTTVTMGASFELDIFDAWNYSSGSSQHGSKLYTGIVLSGRGAGVRWTLANKLMYVKISGLPASTSCVLTIQTLVNDEMYTYTITVTSTAGGVATFLLSSAVALGGAPAIANFFHLHISAVNQAITAGTVSIGTTAQPGFKQYSLAQFDQLNQVVEKIRFSALNLMFSNTAQELYKGGVGAGRQMPSNIDPFNVALLGFDSFSTKPEAGRLGIKNGIHMFYKSTDLTDWEYMDVGDPADNGSGGGNYIIDTEQDYLAVCLSQPQATERGGYVSVFTNVEYKHNSVWFPLFRPDHTRRVFEDALEIISGIPQVHENPFHIKDIFKWIGQHKGQIQQTISGGAQAFGGARARGYADVANDFLDIWFK